MGTTVRRKRIRRAFRLHEETEPSTPYPERGIGRLPKKKTRSATDRGKTVHAAHLPETSAKPVKKQRPLHPIETKLKQNGILILRTLAQRGGFMPLGDHSPPQIIQAEFPMSKRAFKQAIGHLWKHRKIDILPGTGIRLKQKSSAKTRIPTTPSGNSPIGNFQNKKHKYK
ncbi:hypothetical protein AMJ86_05000 [bacterium SM23_57]|nr:MAG: hypothetical protein AMJ86_05000 [bacterium SM23_57]